MAEMKTREGIELVERYYHAIQSATIEKVNTKAQEIHTEAQQLGNTPQTRIELQVIEQTHAEPASSTLPPQMRPLDSL
jgi:hypothetical protein